MSAAVYGTSPTKRRRRTKAEIAALCDAAVTLLADDHPMTVRQLFYRLVSVGAIPKTENEYKGTVGRLLLRLRREGAIPYGWVADNTRWARKPRTHRGMAAALRDTAATYRRPLWDTQAVYVEIWCEKDALAGVLYEETEPWAVPLMVCRGFASESYVYAAAEAIRAQGKPAHLYLLTDHDPSGLAIAHDVERRIRGFLPTTEVHVERVAVTEDQIERWKLPTRPTKRGDSRSKEFRGESVDVDAIPSGQLRALVRECITQHIDWAEYERLIATEEAERAGLADLARYFSAPAPEVA